MSEYLAAILRTASATRRRERAAKRLDAAARILGAAAADLAEILADSPGRAVDMRRAPWRSAGDEIVTRPGEGETWWTLLRRVTTEGDALVVEVVQRLQGARRTLLVLSCGQRLADPPRAQREPVGPTREPVSALDAVVECAAAEVALRVAVERSSRADTLSGFYGDSAAMREEREDARATLDAARERAGRAAGRLHEAVPMLAVPCIDMRDMAWGIVAEAEQPRLVTMVEGSAAKVFSVNLESPFRFPLPLDTGMHCVVETARTGPAGRFAFTRLLTVSLRDDEAALRAAKPAPPSPTTPTKPRRPRTPRPPAPIPITRKRRPR